MNYFSKNYNLLADTLEGLSEGKRAALKADLLMYLMMQTEPEEFERAVIFVGP